MQGTHGPERCPTTRSATAPSTEAEKPHVLLRKKEKLPRVGEPESHPQVPCSCRLPEPQCNFLFQNLSVLTIATAAGAFPVAGVLVKGFLTHVIFRALLYSLKKKMIDLWGF